MPRNCTVTEPPITPSICTECPEIAAVPPSVTEHPVLGWNAGANSIAELDGDLHVVFYPGTSTGVVLGFKRDRGFQTDPVRIEHGFWIAMAGVARLAYVAELGVRKSNPVQVAPTDRYEIVRRAGVVSYYRNNRHVYTSRSASYGPLIVNCCMYATGDSVA